jgi:hypothetical protein
MRLKRSGSTWSPSAPGSSGQSTRGPASIERVTKGEALAGGAPKEPLVKVTPAANATYKDPALTKRLVATLGVGRRGQAKNFAAAQ